MRIREKIQPIKLLEKQKALFGLFLIWLDGVKTGFVRVRRGTVGKLHLQLLNRVTWYSKWHRHPQHRKVHYSALALTCLLVGASIATTLFPNPSGVEAAVATWDFAHDNTKYDYDSSKVSMAGGNASLTNPGSVTGASTNINASSGITTNASAQFASANKEYLTIPSNSSLQTGDIDFEIGGWVRLDSKTANQVLVNRGGNLGANIQEYTMAYSYTSDRFKAYIGNGSAFDTVVADNFGAVSINTWYYIRVWRDKTASTFNISVNNGTANSISSSKSYIGSSALVIGNDLPNGIYYLNGRLDSWYFQKRVSTTNEATSLYNAGAGRTYNDLTSTNGLDTFKTELTSWWDFNEESGTRQDAKGTNHLKSTADPIIAPPAYGSELIVNPGFETTGAGGADVFGGWSESYGDGAIEDEGTLVHSGSHAAKLTHNTLNNYVSATFTVTAGASYYLSFWSMGDGTNSGSHAVYDLTNSAYIGSTSVSTNNNTTTYQLYTTQFTAPAGCTSIRILLRSTYVTGGITYFDDVSAKRITTAGINNGGFDDRPATGGQSTNVSSVSVARSTNVATIVATNHGLKNADSVTTTGFSDASFNAVNKIVTVVDVNTFTFASTGTDKGTTADTGGRIATDVFSSWSETTAGATTINAETAAPYSGAYAARIETDASTSMANLQLSSCIIGKKYTANIYAKTSATTTTIRVDSGVAPESVLILTTSYSLYTSNFIALSSNIYLGRYVGASKSIYIDQLTLTSLGPTAEQGIAAGNAVDGNFGAGFNGTSTQYLNKANTSSLQVGDIDFEVGAWVYQDFVRDSFAGIMTKGTITSSGSEYNLVLDSGKPRFLVRKADNSNYVSATLTDAIPVGVWAYVRGWHSASEDKIYVSVNNGTPVSTALSGGAYLGVNDLRVGIYSSVSMIGRIDGAYKINRNLSVDEATHLYNNGIGLKYASLPDSIKNDSALKGYWNLDEKSGIRYDSTSNGNNLTDNGTVTQVQGVNFYEGTVGTVFDASGNNNTFTQTTLAKRPTYSQSGMGGEESMLFDGVDDGLVAGTDLVGTGDVSLTMVMNAKSVGGAGAARIVYVGGFIFRMTANKLYLSSDGAGSGVYSADNSIAYNNNYVVTVIRKSSGLASFYINGVLSGSADQNSGVPVGSGTTFLGNSAGYDRGFDGYISGVQIHKNILDPLHRNNLEKTLGVKYGITVATDNGASSAVSSLYPTISLNQSLQYATISSFTPTLSGSSTGIPRYQLTTDSTSAAGSSATASYYYHNGTNWVSANKYNAYQSNTASEIDANIATLKNDVPSGGANFVKWRAFLITDGVDNPSITSINSNYISDTKAPTNPTSLVSTITPLDSATPQTIATNEWHNSKTLHLTWPTSRNQSDPETDANRGGAIDQINENEIYSGVAGYNLYFGEDPSADPTSTSGLINANSSPHYQAATTIDLTNLPLESGKTYYFLIETKDLAGNIAHFNQRALEEPPVLDTPLFVYKYDAVAPTQVDYINVSPVGCSTASNFTFTWQPATDTNSGVFGYQYKSSMNGEVKETTETSITVPPYRDDENVFYVRTKDNAGNTTPNWQSAVFCSTGGTYINDGPNTTIDISSFKVDWTSSKPTTSTVTVYDEKDTQVAQVNNETLSLTHQITITGLKPGQDYTYQVSWKDSYNNPGSIEKKAVKTQRISIIDGPTITAGPSSIEVAWVSSQPTTSYVQVFDGNTYISEQGRTEFVQAHKVRIVGLEAEKSYRYRVLWTDQFGNIDYGSWGETVTANIPQVINLKSDVLSPTRLLVSWNTNYQANSTIDYGKGSLSDSIKMDGFGTSFSKEVTNLEPGSNYQLRIKAVLEDGTNFSAGNTFQTPPLPAISALRFEPLKDTSHATYKAFWTTNIETSSAIYYKVQGGGDYKSKASAELTKEHEILLDSMEDQATYELYAQSTDSYGNVVKSDLNTIKTPNDSRPPKITNLSTSVKSSGFADNQKAQVIVTWDTDELTTSQVEYANGIEGTEYQNRTKEETALSTSHVVVISDLEPSKIYHLRAISKDQAGNPSYSTDTTVITGKVQKSVLDIILASLQRSLGWITKLFK